MKTMRAKYVLSLATLCIVYFVTAKIGLSLVAVSGFASTIWPPSGIALAALLLFGYRLWPAIMLAAFLVNLSMGASPLIALGIAIGNTLEPLVGAFLLKKFVGFKSSLERVKDVLGLVILAAIFCTMISATIGVGSLFIGGTVTASTFQNTWTAWWVGDMLGIIVVTPLLLVLADNRRKITLKKLHEPFLAAIILALICIASLSGIIWQHLEPNIFVYLIFPPLLWIAFRYGQRGSVNAIFIVTVIALFYSTIASPAHSTNQVSQSLILLQRFIGIVSATFMIICAILAERHLAEANERKLREQTILLRQQSSHLKLLNQAKDEFISLASHQLRTPVSGIKMNLGMLLDGHFGDLSKQQRKALEATHQYNERQVQIIEDLLGIVQLDMGNVILKKERTDMKVIVYKVIEGLSAKISERKQTISFAPDNNRYISNVDKTKISIVIENLIDNASKYSQAGKKIEVELKSNKNKLEILVKDEGVGIAQKDMNKLFKKFSRIENELSVERGGNGLGLYWVKKIVKLHGGTIKVTSKPGKGTTFLVRL
jgi:signal transduction histidine kinase